MSEEERQTLAGSAETLSGALDATRRHVTEDPAVSADEDDTVSGRVAFIPFQFLIWDRNSRPVWDDTLAVCDDGDVLLTANVEAVSFKGIGFSAARHMRIVRLHQFLEPLPQIGGPIIPLSVIACHGWQRYEHEDRNKAEHVASSKSKRSVYVYEHSFAGTITSPISHATLDVLLAAGHGSGLRFFAGLLDELRKSSGPHAPHKADGKIVRRLDRNPARAFNTLTLASRARPRAAA
jgi:hypothetical protein